MGMKFDVAILNPPYSSPKVNKIDQTSNVGNKMLGLQIVRQVMTRSQYGAFVLPFNQVDRMRHDDWGICNVSREVSNLFNICLRGIHVFYYCQNTKSIDIREAVTGYPKPTKPGIDIIMHMSTPYRFQKNIKQRYAEMHCEHKQHVDEIPPGCVRYWDSASTSGYIALDNPNIALDPTRGKWRVFVCDTTMMHKIGALDIAEPEDFVACLRWCFDTRDEAERFLQYLESDKVRRIVRDIKVFSTSNSAKLFSYIPLPDFLK